MEMHICPFKSVEGYLGPPWSQAGAIAVPTRAAPTCSDELMLTERDLRELEGMARLTQYDSSTHHNRIPST